MSSNNAIKHSFVKVEKTTGSALCQQLVGSVLDDYTQQLIDIVEKSTHGLSVNDIHDFLAQYKTQAIVNDQSTFKEHFQRCLNRREQEVFDPNRRQPFKRVLTMRFVDLFPPEGALDDSGTYVSRRLLPGLFLALEKMVGSDPFDKGFKACLDVLDVITDDNGVVIWEDLYTHPAALKAVDDLLMRLVEHFDNPMKRITWMLNIINNDLADPHEFDFEGAVNQNWQLDDHGLINVLRHLFRNLRHRLKDKEHAGEITKKYGEGAARQLVALIKTLDHVNI
jgi:uncharacterized protein YbgA (DUF1722 family)